MSVTSAAMAEMISEQVLVERYNCSEEVARYMVQRNFKKQLWDSVQVESILKCWVDAGLTRGELFRPEPPVPPPVQTITVWHGNEWITVSKEVWATYQAQKRAQR